MVELKEQEDVLRYEKCYDVNTLKEIPGHVYFFYDTKKREIDEGRLSIVGWQAINFQLWIVQIVNWKAIFNCQNFILDHP